MKKVLLKFSDALLSKEQMQTVKGAYDGGGGGGGGGGGYGGTFQLYCVTATNWTFIPPVITGSGCPSWEAADSICRMKGGIRSNLYC